MNKILLGVVVILVVGALGVAVYSFIPSKAGAPSGYEEQQASGTGTPTQQATSSVATGTGTSATFTLAQVAEHAVATDCYTAVNGSVYNLTSFVNQHPGGKAILKICGKDGTAAFTAQHGDNGRAQAELATLKIGTLAQ